MKKLSRVLSLFLCFSFFLAFGVSAMASVKIPTVLEFDKQTKASVPKTIAQYILPKAKYISFELMQDDDEFLGIKISYELPYNTKKTNDLISDTLTTIGLELIDVEEDAGQYLLVFEGYDDEKNMDIAISFIIDESDNSDRYSQVNLVFATEKEFAQEIIDQIELPEVFKEWKMDDEQTTPFYIGYDGKEYALKVYQNGEFKDIVNIYREKIKENHHRELLYELQHEQKEQYYSYIDSTRMRYENDKTKEGTHFWIYESDENEAIIEITKHYYTEKNPYEFTKEYQTNDFKKLNYYYRDYFDKKFSDFYSQKFEDGKIYDSDLYFTSERNFADTIIFFKDRFKKLNVDLNKEMGKKNGTIEINGTKFDWWVSEGSDTEREMDIRIEVFRCISLGSNDKTNKVGAITGRMSIAELNELYDGE